MWKSEYTPLSFNIMNIDKLKAEYEELILKTELVGRAPLKKLYEYCCEEYRRRLNAQWDFDIKDSWWVADIVGGTLCLCDLEYSLDMEDVRLFVDNGIPFENFLEWWNYNLYAFNYAKHPINSHSWFILGARPENL